jgi:hypothetical protein
MIRGGSLSNGGIDQESFQVPEEIEEELPLRIRTVTYENEESSTQAFKMYFNKYLDHGS